MTKAWRRENGTGTVTKLGGRRRKPWVAYSPHRYVRGEPIRDYLGTFMTYGDAERAILAHSHSPALTRGITTMDDLFGLLYTQKERSNLSENSLKAMKASYNHIAELGSYEFPTLSAYDFQEIINKLIDEGSSFSKVSKIRSVINQLYEMAIKIRLMNVNYSKYIDISQAVEGKVYPFTERDIQILTKNDNDRIAKTGLILAYTGLRIGTFLSLEKFCNINLADNMIIAGSKTEAGRNRRIPIHNKIRPYIEYFYSEYPDCPLLFSRNGEEVYPDYYRKFYHNPMVKRLGVSDYTPHSYRHTFATKMREGGVTEKALATIMGHTDANFTDKRYVDLSDDFLHEQIMLVR